MSGRIPQARGPGLATGIPCEPHVDDRRVLRGFCEHPSVVAPLPVLEAKPVVVFTDAAAEGAGFVGNLYIDGSCSKQLVPELNRAGFAAVVCNPAGAELGSLTGQVPAWLPQTPQAAEHCGLAYTLRELKGESSLAADCLNVVALGESVKQGGPAPGAYGRLYLDPSVRAGLRSMKGL